jgi:hypothetical protein
MYMNALTRALLTLAAAAAAGCLLWVASTQFDTHRTGGYWAAMGVIAGGGLLLGLAQLRGGGGNPPGYFLLAFVPLLVAGTWIVVAAQPHGNTFRSHVRAWDGDLGITRAVQAISLWNGVVALGIGLVFGLTMEPGLLGRRRHAVVTATEPAAVEEPAADEPTTREREEAPSTDTTTTRTPTRTVRG